MLGDNGVFAISPAMTTRKDPKGWLVEMMNLVSQLHKYITMSVIKMSIGSIVLLSVDCMV
jgi:hypothetical protein